MSAAVYSVGSAVVYGRTGVCRVEDIGTPPFQKDDGRSYYTLRPVFSTCGERIYTPVDGAAPIRGLVDGGRASGCLKLVSELKPQTFSSRKPAELAAHYRELLSPCELESCLLLLKEIRQKERTLTAQGKKLGQVDYQYQKIAERLACEELGFALDTEPDIIRERLYEAMKITK